MRIKSFSKIFISVFFITLFALILVKNLYCAEEKWPGVDSAVVEKYAKQYGRETREPLINTDQGDLLLFIFTLAGCIGGFVMGYNFRKIFKEKEDVNLSRT